MSLAAGCPLNSEVRSTLESRICVPVKQTSLKACKRRSPTPRATPDVFVRTAPSRRSAGVTFHHNLAVLCSA